MIGNNSIAALDIGDYSIVAGFARIDNRGKIVSLDIAESRSNGINKGIITDLDKLTDSIHLAAKSLSTQAKVHIKNVFVNISGANVITRHSHAAIPLTDRTNKVISVSDIKKINRQAKLMGGVLSTNEHTTIILYE